MTIGWLFDVYSLHDRIILWIKNKKMHRIEKGWTPSLYVSSQNRYKLEKLLKNPQLESFIKNAEWVERIEKVSDLGKSKVLKLTIKNSFELVRLAKMIEELDNFGVYKLYNVDVPPEQSYFYEYDLYPLGKYKIQNRKL